MLKVAGVGFAALAGACAQAALYQVALDVTHWEVPVQDSEWWVSGTIDVLQDNGGPIVFSQHAYHDGDYIHRIDTQDISQDYLQWLGSGAAFEAGAHYSGALFKLVQHVDDIPGEYNHNFNSPVDPAQFYVYETGHNDPDHRSNIVGYTVTVVPEPATMALLGLGVVPLLRKRR